MLHEEASHSWNGSHQLRHPESSTKVCHDREEVIQGAVKYGETKTSSRWAGWQPSRENRKRTWLCPVSDFQFRDLICRNRSVAWACLSNCCLNNLLHHSHSHLDRSNQSHYFPYLVTSANACTWARAVQAKLKYIWGCEFGVVHIHA